MLENLVKTVKKTAATGILTATALLAACNGGGGRGGNPCETNPTGPGCAPTPVTQQIQVLNSDGTNLGSTSYQGNANEAMTISYSSLASKGINTQISDPNYFVIREANQGDKIGNYVAHTTNGTVSFTPTNGQRIVWLMNNTNGADYAGAWASGLGRNGIRNNARYGTVIKLTAQNNTISTFQVQDGDMSMIIQGLDILNNAWNANGIQLASLAYSNSSSTGDLKAGIGVASTHPTSAGVRSNDTYIINPQISSTASGRGTSAVEALEGMLSFDDLFGQNSTPSLFNTPLDYQFKPVGKDYASFGVLMPK